MGFLYAFTALVFFVVLLFYFIVIPGRSNGREKGFTGVMYAHRGLHGGDVPENSLEAFRLAVEGGYGIELDIRLTKDGRVIVFHDDSLERVCGDARFAADCLYDELPTLPDGSRIPLFSEVLELVDGKVPILVELKGTTTDTAVCSKGCEMLDTYAGAYCVESFDPFLLRWYKKNRPDVFRGQLGTHIEPQGMDKRKQKLTGFVLSHLLTGFICRPHFIAYDINSIDEPMLGFLRNIFSVPVYVWTLHSLSDAETALTQYEGAIFEKK